MSTTQRAILRFFRIIASKLPHFFSYGGSVYCAAHEPKEHKKMFRNSVVAAGAQIARALRPCVALGLVAYPLGATAGDLTFKLEPGVALPLSAPQSDLYGAGGGESLKALFGLNRYLDIGPTASF